MKTPDIDSAAPGRLRQRLGGVPFIDRAVMTPAAWPSEPAHVNSD
jgi:hypothetical protein